MNPFAPPPLLAFVANPMILGWLAAAGAPLVIHLLNRRKFRESTWAAMQFLLAAMKKNSRRMQLEQWLLLAVRTLLIILAVVAAAEPGFRGAEQLVASGERVHRIVVVDGSFSMNYRPTGQLSYFEQAQNLADRIVDNSREGDGYSLVILGTPSTTIVGPPLFRREEFRTIVDDLRQPHGAGNLPQCLNEIDKLLAKARAMHPQIRRRIVYFITDLGRHTWEPADAARGDNSAAEFQARCERWGADTAVSLIDVGGGDGDNTAVVALDTTEPYAVVGLPTTLRAVVRNFGRQAKSRVPISLIVDGRKVEDKTIDLDPAGEATIEFDYPALNPPRAPGGTIYEVELGPDRLEIDNRRYLVVEAKPNIRVLVLRDAIASDEEEFGLENLTTALKLRPGAEPGRASPVVVDVETDEVLQRRELNEYDCVFIVGLKRLTPSQAKIIATYLREGGGLVTWLGPRVDAADYNQLLADGPERILPAKIGAIVAEPQYKLNPLKYEHPLIAEFRGSDQGNLLNTPVYRYYRVDLTDRPQTRRIMEFLNDAKDPFLVSESIGAGRSLLVTTSPQASWTTMPLSPGFVPIVQELLSFASGGRAERGSRLVGEALEGSFRRTTATAQVTVIPPVDPDADSIQVSIAAPPTPSGTGGPRAAAGVNRAAAAEVLPAGEFFRWSFAETRLSGIYAVTIAAADESKRRFAVNVDSRESATAKLSPNRLTSLPWSAVPLHYATNLQDFDEPARQFVAVDDSNPIHRWFLLAALAAAVGETLIAGRSGRGRR